MYLGMNGKKNIIKNDLHKFALKCKLFCLTYIYD